MVDLTDSFTKGTSLTGQLKVYLDLTDLVTTQKKLDNFLKVWEYLKLKGLKE